MAELSVASFFNPSLCQGATVVIRVGSYFASADSPMHLRPPSHGPALLPSFIRAVEDVRGVRIVRLQGPVGMQIAQEERAAEEASEAAAGAFSRPLLFDFEATTAWDSSTIASLVQALRRRSAVHAKVGLINARPKLLAILEISRLLAMFPIYSSEEEALAKLAD
jgi:anti-anti-sigma factor